MQPDQDKAIVEVPDYCLIADVGGTHTRLAIVDAFRTINHLETFQNEDFDELGNILEYYIGRLPAVNNPAAGVFAVASPVQEDEVHFTNRNWNFSITEYCSRFSFNFLDVLNDFVAVALAVPGLKRTDYVKIGDGEQVNDKPIAVIGPGTGLGVSILVPVADRWLPISSEGGHVTLPAFTDEEEKIIALVRHEQGHVSAERLLSGPGLTLLYRAIATLQNSTVTESDPAVITARDETGDDPIASKTLDVFMNMLGTVAANLAVTAGALGGIYIAGGILPRIRGRFVSSGFRDRFTDKGRYHDYLARIPTYLITRENIAMHGLRDYLSGVSVYSNFSVS